MTDELTIRDTFLVSQKYCQEVANDYLLSMGRDWYVEDHTYQRTIWLNCADLCKMVSIDNLSDELKQGVALVHLRVIWHAGISMVIEGVLARSNGEYNIPMINTIINEFNGFWHAESAADADFYDALETTVIDACAQGQINVTCIRVMCDALNISLNDLCVLPTAPLILN